MSDSRQHWLDRNRPPRVQITYDVETLGSSAKQEIPFVAGIMGDFAGPGNAAGGKKLSERGFVEIDRDNFGQVMAAQKASLDLGTKKLRAVSRTGDPATPYVVSTAAGADAHDVAVALDIASLEDFSPRAILEQLGHKTEGSAIAEMMKTRQYLSELLVKIQGNVVSAGDLLSQSRTELAAAVPAKLADATKALQAAGLKIDPAVAALSAFAAGATGEGKFDTAAFAADDKTAFEKAMGEVTTAAGTGNKAVAAVIAALKAAPAAEDAPAITAAANGLSTVRGKVDVAVQALNTAVSKLTDKPKADAAGPLATTATNAATDLATQTDKARAATDAATRFASPAS